MPSLFDPVRLGSLVAPNRILMAPLTRARATRQHVPTPMMAAYYAQRATAGRIICEATGISRQGLGWPFAPGLWSEEQVAGWSTVTDAVHRAGGQIIAQLWHMGRQVHPDYLDGAMPVSASALAAPNPARTYAGKTPSVVPRALGLTEIAGVVDDYRRAAGNAMTAGFDGVQVHAANGYLIDQFLCDSSNRRADEYGGSIENRARFLVEVVKGVGDVVGCDRTSVRLSPSGPMAGVDDSDPVALFTAVASRLSPFGIAFLELREPGRDSTFHAGTSEPLGPTIRKVFTGPLVLNSDYTRVRAEAALADGLADAISFGRPFIANPDLPSRLMAGTPLAYDDMATWYTQGADGYTDYPTARLPAPADRLGGGIEPDLLPRA